TDDGARFVGDRARGVAKKPRNFEPEDEGSSDRNPQRPVPGERQHGERRRDNNTKQREDDELGEPIAGEAETIAPAKGIIFGAKPVAADVADILEVARIDDIVRAVGALALA